jgi:hypothetical protein
MENPLLEMLATVLRPLGDKAPLVLRWFEDEVATRPIITHVDDGSIDDKGNALAWKLGGPSVLDANSKIFAILQDENSGDVIVYSFTVQKAVGENGEELGAIQFFRELVCDPKHIHGPISHAALFNDLQGIFVGDPQEKTNGAAHPPRN